MNEFSFGQKSVMNVLPLRLYLGARTLLCSTRDIHPAATFE